MAVSRMRNKKYAIWPLVMAQSPKLLHSLAMDFSAMGQILCSTERISSFNHNTDVQLFTLAQCKTVECQCVMIE